MSCWLVAVIGFVTGFAVGMSVVTFTVGRWVWNEFQKQRSTTADGEGFPKPPPFVKN
jgi:uncharacterized membrane-anchored protein YhcB (DUF1043 family)